MLKEELEKNQNQIVKKVRDRWKLGLRPNGEIIGEYSSFSYQQEKISSNPSAKGNVDLVDTGNLQDELVINHLTGSLFTIFSDDEKATLIAQKYGLDVFGLTDFEKAEVLSIAGGMIHKRLFDFVGF